jgi:hypothetical protein
MAQKPKKPAASKAKVKPQHHENALERFGEEVEERFFEGAELATSTTSPETNALLAVEGAILGPRTPKDKAAKKRSDGKPKNVRSKKR